MKPEINRHDILEKITPLIENTAMRFGYIPIEIEFVKENHRWFLRIYLYSSEKDVTLDDCEKVTRSLSDFLDELIPVKYYLEVSSPGLERKFKSEKEFVIFKGRNSNNRLRENRKKSLKAKLLTTTIKTGWLSFALMTDRNYLYPKAISNLQNYI